MVHVPDLRDVLGLAVVGAEREAVRPELGDERRERLEVSRGGRLPDQHPHPRAQALAALLGRVALVVGADPGGGVGLQAGPEEAGRVPVHVRRLEPELVELVRVAGDDAGVVHHLGEPDHAPAAEESLQVPERERAPRRLELRRGHARRGHEEDVERHLVGDVGEPVDPVRAEHVRDLVRVGDDRRRPHRQDEARELVHEELHGLQVHVRVDQPGDDVLAARVHDLLARVGAEPGDVAVADRDLGLEPLAREDGEDLAALDDDVRDLVAARDGEAPGQIRHGASLKDRGQVQRSPSGDLRQEPRAR